jgi:hypothetical protein
VSRNRGLARARRVDPRPVVTPEVLFRAVAAPEEVMEGDERV